MVWALLTYPGRYDTSAASRVERVEPSGTARPSQVVMMSSGAVGLRFRARFPLGIRMREHISVRRLDRDTRVQYG